MPDFQYGRPLGLETIPEAYRVSERLGEISRGHEFKVGDTVIRISDRRPFIISAIKPVVEAGRPVTLYLLECLRTKATITVGFEGLMRDFNVPISKEESEAPSLDVGEWRRIKGTIDVDTWLKDDHIVIVERSKVSPGWIAVHGVKGGGAIWISDVAVSREEARRQAIDWMKANPNIKQQPKMANKDQAKEEILSAVRRWWHEELGDTAYSLDQNLLRELKNLKTKYGV